MKTADALLAEYDGQRQQAVRRRMSCWLAIAAVTVGGAARVERLLDGWEPCVDLWARVHARTARALAAEAAGRSDEAAELFAEAAEGWRTWGSVPLRAYALLGLGACSGDEAALAESEAIFAVSARRPCRAAVAPARQQQV